MLPPLDADTEDMTDNVDRSLLDIWKQMRDENSDDRRIFRTVGPDYATSGSSACALEDQVTRARRHIRSRRGAVRLAQVIQLHAVVAPGS
jgi:hypothetical protein